MARGQPRIFVLLSPTRNASDWEASYRDGTLPDWSPYGYGHAEELGYTVAYSKTFNQSLIVRAIDAGARLLLGFKFVHAIRNWKSCADPAVAAIWTHTEREHLPLLLLSWCLRRPLPPVIAQSVWLLDEWDRMRPLHRLIARALMRKAAVCTFLSPINAAKAEQLGLGTRRKVVPFGVSADSFPLTAPAARNGGDAIRVFALGNDRHRDWPTFVQAFCHDRRFDVFAATGKFPLPGNGANWTARPCTHTEVVERYRWCDVVVVALTANQHASGITAVLEATFMGKPVVVSDAGGIDWYFDRDEVAFCPVGDSASLRDAVLALAGNPERALASVRAAQASVVRKDLSSKGYARRHLEMTEALLRAGHAQFDSGVQKVTQV
jgi:glycosyltransferase involved in cell wall biosynthesis